MKSRRVDRVSSDPLLASVCAQRDAESQAQVAKLTAVLDWAAAHVADDVEAAELLDPMVELRCTWVVPGVR